MIYRNSALTRNAWYKMEDAFYMQRKYVDSGQGAHLIPKPDGMMEFPMKLSLSHFTKKETSTPTAIFGFKPRTPSNAKMGVTTFRDEVVPHFCEQKGFEPRDPNSLLLMNCILVYTPPASVYASDIHRYQVKLHAVVEFFQQLNGRVHATDQKVMSCEFIEMTLSFEEAACWAHLWMKEEEAKTAQMLNNNRY
jgi:hypothetical protein